MDLDIVEKDEKIELMCIMVEGYEAELNLFDEFRNGVNAIYYWFIILSNTIDELDARKRCYYAI